MRTRTDRLGRTHPAPVTISTTGLRLEATSPVGGTDDHPDEQHEPRDGSRPKGLPTTSGRQLVTAVARHEHPRRVVDPELPPAWVTSGGYVRERAIYLRIRDSNR
jgi:hypothetical protein